MKRTLAPRFGNSLAWRSLAVAALCSAMAGCGSSKQLFTGDGRPTTLVQCPAEGSWDGCTENARGICQGDFDAIKQSTSKGMHDLLFACKAQQQ
jgi:hypothetical protein